MLLHNVLRITAFHDKHGVHFLSSRCCSLDHAQGVYTACMPRDHDGTYDITHIHNNHTNTVSDDSIIVAIKYRDLIIILISL